MPFVARVPVRFGDVDWARIAYYPRLLHLLHVAFEDLFEHHVGIPYAQVLSEMNLGEARPQVVALYREHAEGLVAPQEGHVMVLGVLVAAAMGSIRRRC